jgi:uncharacterized protein
MKKILSFVITLLFSMTLLTPVMAEITVPPKPKDNSYVHDLANMLTTEHTRKMMAIGSSIEKASGAEIVVVTVETLGENTIEEYANILFRSWGIGDKEKNNGVLLLVNKENVLAGESGRVRIEVGYGLEGAIPDGKAGRILDEYVLPPWTELDYSTGIYQGFMSIAKAVVDEYNLELDQEQALRDSIRPKTTPWVNYTLILINLFMFYKELFLPPNQLELLINRFGLIPAKIITSNWWYVVALDFRIPLTLITSMFLHGSLLHISGNMLYLWVFGDNVGGR